MTWEIVVGIIALVGFVASIGGMVWKLATLISDLKATVKELSTVIGTLRGENATEHTSFRNQLTDHEKRIGHLEGKVS